MDALDRLQLLLGGQSGWQGLPFDPNDRGAMLQRPPLPGGLQGGGGPPPSLFDLPGEQSRQTSQPSLPLNLRPVPTESELPFALQGGGGYAPGSAKRPERPPEPLNLQAVYNSLFGLPLDLSVGGSMRPGRGLGQTDVRGTYRIPL
jgi:hypothetical protein